MRIYSALRRGLWRFAWLQFYGACWGLTHYRCYSCDTVKGLNLHRICYKCQWENLQHFLEEEKAND